MALSTLVLVYVVGGVTFIPLVGLLALAFAYVAFTQPVAAADSIVAAHESDKIPIIKAEDELAEKSRTQQNEPDVAAAYFAVCREYVPGGINGKPPERSTPAGEVLIAESPSVYQSMYRSIFERGKTQIPTIEGQRDGKAVKKARNVFFVVLRHGHLMLYDDSEQVEVRHVISLAHHDIDVHAGGDAIPEGDLWTKRNCIRLIRKPLSGDAAPSSRPFYFFSDNCSEKEDFYHALLLAQSIILDTDAPPVPQKFDTPDIIKLVQHLHASDADAHTRWLNGLIGRVFLALYKTEDIENFIRAKINRKISRVPKPNFITSITIKEIDMGDSGPIVSNPRLKELSVSGDMTVEMDIKYTGAFKLQMGAVARIDLGTRFKAREVHLVMAGILKKLSGHLLIRIKPPPSNRIWMTFETMPQIEMSIEPIVSSRQITYGVILRAIESRIREVIGETIVFPNWDDSPFLNTFNKEYRGGIFETTRKDLELDSKPVLDKPAPEEPEPGMVETAVHQLVNSTGDGEIEDPPIHMLADTNAKTMSMPSLFDPVQRLSLRKAAKKSATSLAGDVGSSSSMSVQAPTSPPLRPRTPPGKPRNLRSNSFASAATPLVSTEGSNIEAVKMQTKKKHFRDAVELVKEVNSRSQPGSPVAAPRGASRDGENVFQIDASQRTAPGVSDDKNEAVLPSDVPDSSGVIRRRRSEPMDQVTMKEQPNLEEPTNATTSSSSTTHSATPRSSMSFEATDQPAPPPSHLSTAANVAKKWGWQVLNRQKESSSPSSGSTFGFGKHKSTPSTTSVNSTQSSSHAQPPNPNALKAALLAQPMGRGQPLPPPGTPLPGPQKSLWSSSNLNLGSLKRKPVGANQAPQLPARKTEDQEHVEEEVVQHRQPPPLPRRPKPAETEDDPERLHGGRQRQQHDQDPDVFVVAAPVEDDSSPTTPIIEPTEEHGIPTQVEQVQETPRAAGSHESPYTTEQQEKEAAEQGRRQTRDSSDQGPAATVVAEEPTKPRPHDVHDSDREIGDSLDAADVSGEMGAAV